MLNLNILNMSQFNPTIFNHNNQVFALIRNETNTKIWDKSVLSYSICKLDTNLNILDSDSCRFKINNEIFTSIKRDDLRKDRYCIEDVKILKLKINNKIIGVANILIQHKSPRIFRVGLVELNINDNTLELIKILEVDNMNDTEKNWFLFEKDNTMFVIYKLFPKLVLYQLNKDDFSLSLYKIEDTSYIIDKNIDLFSNLSQYYSNLYFTPCNIINESDQTYTLIVKKKTNMDWYEYYKLSFNFDDLTMHLFPKILFSGYKCYLNDIKTINNELIGCFGISDIQYKFINLSNYINMQN